MLRVVALLVLPLLGSALLCDSTNDTLEKLFCVIDLDHSGGISVLELKMYTAHNRADLLKDNGGAAFHKSLDTDGSGEIEYGEFATTYGRLRSSSIETEPEQVHISLITPTSMMVMWVTHDKTDTTTVQYGTAQNQLSQTTTGSTHTYTAGGWVGVIHQVLLENLSAGDTRYFYRVGDPKGGWSNVFNFVTPPTSPRANTFAVYGDMGTAIPLGFAVTEQMERDNAKSPFDLMVHCGDIAYASTQFTSDAAGNITLRVGSGEEEFIWDLWFRQVAPIASLVPYMAGVGNHEQFYNYTSYLARFRMPSPWGGPPLPPTAAKFWWSMDFGLVHWIFMSTEHPYNPGTEQYAWLVNDLQAYAANRANVPWVFLTGHRPMYCTDMAELGDHMPGGQLQRVIEPLLTQYKVDMMFAGHMHMYERVNPVRNGTTYQWGTNVYTAPPAPVFVVQGTAGIFQDQQYLNPQPKWSASRMGKFGYGHLTVYNATTLYYEFRGLDDNIVLDHFWIVR